MIFAEKARKARTMQRTRPHETKLPESVTIDNATKMIFERLPKLQSRRFAIRTVGGARLIDHG